VLATVEAPWPPTHGGRLRVARIAEALSNEFRVSVVHPGPAGDPRPGIEVVVTDEPAPARPLRSGVDVLQHEPRLGLHFRRALEPGLVDLLADRPDSVLYWTHSYLAAAGPALSRPEVVEFANLEHRRFSSLSASRTGPSRWVGAREARKAARWEPSVATRADLAVALSEQDARWLTDQGASTVLAVNGADPVPTGSSAEQGPVVMVASFGYPPNAEAAMSFVQRDWPAIREAVPWAELQLVGRGASSALADLAGTPGVDIVGDVPSVSPYLSAAALCISPVVSGGGSQLKISEALAHGRAVVATTFAAAGLPTAVTDTGAVRCVSAADLAPAVVRLLTHPAARARAEAAARAYAASATWEGTTNALRLALLGLAQGAVTRR
jgi:hypothetical protein